jgi:AcrR family transcriptional regulator
MKRVVKDAEVRHKELLDISENLIIEKGYDDLTVSDIISRAGIAKGTFYHYFRSKDDVLLALVDRYMDGIVKIMEDVYNDNSINAAQKIFKLFRTSMEYRLSHQNEEMLADYIHDEKNVLVHHQLEVKNVPILEDLFERLIIEGVEEGIFKVDYPKESALAIVATLGAFGHRKNRLKDLSIDEKILAFRAFIDLLERILGTEKGEFKEVTKLLEGYK